MLDKYEIHYVKNGLKKVFVRDCNAMNEFDAWKAALLADGECVGTTVSLRTLSDAIHRADANGIAKVRWNKASHVVSWSERARQSQNTLPVRRVD